MVTRPPISTPTYTRFPYTTLFRSAYRSSSPRWKPHSRRPRTPGLPLRKSSKPQDPEPSIRLPRLQGEFTAEDSVGQFRDDVGGPFLAAVVHQIRDSEIDEHLGEHFGRPADVGGLVPGVEEDRKSVG